jgi:hypothetical protein
VAGGNATTWSIAYTATNSGTYAALVTSFYSGGVGTYRLTVNNLSDGPKLCAPSISVTNVFVTGIGGTEGQAFILLTSTNVDTQLTQWTPVYTNHFDHFGNFRFTNSFIPGPSRRFYIYQLP